MEVIFYLMIWLVNKLTPYLFLFDIKKRFFYFFSINNKGSMICLGEAEYFRFNYPSEETRTANDSSNTENRFASSHAVKNSLTSRMVRTIERSGDQHDLSSLGKLISRKEK